VQTATPGAGWNHDDPDGVAEPDFKPLSPEEARRWRERQPVQSVWLVVGWQLGLTVAATLVSALVVGLADWPSGKAIVMSVAYGGVCVLLPSAVMAWGMTSSALARRMQSALPGLGRVALAGWLMWEGVKVLLVLAMLWTAPRWIPDLSWLGLVVGLVVALKSYWLAWIARPATAGRSVCSGTGLE